MTENYLRKLEADGVERVLRDMALGEHGSPGSLMRDEVLAWVRSKEFAMSSAAEASSAAQLREMRRARWINVIQIAANAITAIAVVFIGWYLSKAG